MIKAPQRLPDPTAAWVDIKTGRPTREFYQYMRELDQAARELITKSNADAIVLEDFELRITDLETP